MTASLLLKLIISRHKPYSMLMTLT